MHGTVHLHRAGRWVPATGTTAAEKSVLARATGRGATAVADEEGTTATRVGTGAGSRDATETKELSTFDGE